MRSVLPILVALLAVLALPPAALAAPTIVVNLGKYPSAQRAGTDEANVRWGDADPTDDTLCTEAFAALEAQRALRKMTGARNAFAIVDDRAAPAGDLILVGGLKSNALSARFAGALGVSQAELEKLGPEGYRIRSRDVGGRRITLVAGGGRVGTLYGVYDFLHRLGVRWYAPGELHEEIPPRSLAYLPRFDVTESPRFLTRGFHAWENRGDPEFLLWMARNRLNYWCVEQEPKPLLHKLGIMLVGGGHILTQYYLGPNNPYPYDHPAFTGDEGKPRDPYPTSAEFRGDANGDGTLSYFEAHPEWYALIQGQRSSHIVGDGGDNFCTSNRDAMAEWMKNAVADLVEGRYKDAGLMNAWMLDAGRWCECAECRALGTPTDRNLLFVHEYAKAIKQAQAEGRLHRPVRLLFLAYADVLEPPTRPLPPDFDPETCIATYFPITRCYVHRFDDPHCSRNAAYVRHLYGWARDPERHYQGQICIGEYYNVSGYRCLPACFMSTMATDIPYYYARGARHFHYMHCTTKNWGNKALTNWQMARQLWDPGVNCEALWQDYFSGRYGPAAHPMRRFYESLEQMLGNVTELKYGLAGRLQSGAKELFPTTHLRYERTTYPKDDGPDLLEILEASRRCRQILDGVLRRRLPERVRQRVAEDERGFTYGERTLAFYDALARAYLRQREGKEAEARQAFREASKLAGLLKADTTSALHSSSHASAPDALAASYASGALTVLSSLLGPLEPEQVKAWDPARGPLTLTGKEFEGGGATRFGYVLHRYPEREKISDQGNYVYGQGSGLDRIHAWFRLEKRPEGEMALVLVGIKCPQPAGGEVLGEVRVNDTLVFSGSVPFAERDLTRHEVAVPAQALKEGVNRIEVRNTQPGGQVGNRPWFGIDRVELSAR